MKTNLRIEGAETRNGDSITKKYEVIKLSVDWHAREYRVVRIIDNAGPEPAQRFTPEAFLKWSEKQVQLAGKVYSCYEAGAGGFVLHRQLTKRGLINYVVAPYKLDKNNSRVQNDQRDALQLAQDLDRYVRGNKKALRLVYVPTPEQEQQRQQSRQRQQIKEHRMRLASQGRCLLLSQGWVESNQWWKDRGWKKLSAQLPGWLVEALEVFRRLILEAEPEIKGLQQKVEQTSVGPRPKGMGALTFAQLQGEVCDWRRFKNRKSVGAYAGLTGGLSSSGDYVRELPITKAGNIRLRTLLIELAWRWLIYQKKSKEVQRWRKILLERGPHRRARKRALVALARQLLVDLWRWKTGLVKPEDLGWIMVEPAQG